MEAKQDSRIKTSGELQEFEFEEIRWPLNGNPNFYDYLYIMGLANKPGSENLLKYDGFTDIAFNQNRTKKSTKKSFNCQARSAAIYCSLIKRMKSSQVLDFLMELSKIDEKKPEQLGLF